MYSPNDVCHSVDEDGTADDFRSTTYGDIYSYSTIGVTHYLSCGLIRPDATDTTTDDMYVYGYDGNPDTGMEDNIYCNVYTCNSSRSSCKNENTVFMHSFGGTTTPGSNFSGSGFIQFTDIDLDWDDTTTVWCNVPNVYSGTESGLRLIQYIY